jgi:hypothetical protein
MGEFSFEHCARFVSQISEAHTQTAPGLAVYHFCPANDFRVAAERNADQQHRAFGNNSLRVHVQSARADVFRAGHAGDFLAVEMHVDDQALAIVSSSLILSLQIVFRVIGHALLLLETTLIQTRLKPGVNDTAGFGL